MTTKTARIPKAAIEATILGILPWSCTNFGDTSEIEAYAASTGTWETLADVRAVGELDAEDLAAFIVEAVNSYHVTRGQVRELAAVLRDCLAGKTIPQNVRRRAAGILQGLASASTD